MKLRRALLAVSVVLLVAAAAAPPVAPGVGASATVKAPVPTGEIRAITTEQTYAAFPQVDRSSAGTALVIYRVGLGHVAAGSTVRIRRQPTGANWWSDPVQIAAPPAGTDFYWNTGGIASESAAAGGRIWVGLIKAHKTSVNTADQYSAHLSWSDDDGLTWSSPLAMPVASTNRTILSGLLWLPDGTLLASVTHSSSGSVPKTTRVYASTNRGVTWTVRSVPDVDLGTRNADEPRLVPLSGGRLGLIIRSDGSLIGGSNPQKWYYSYLYSAISSDAGATWTEPAWAVWHGTGGPAPTLLPDGRVAIVHRGQSEPTNHSADDAMLWPTRITVLDENMAALHGIGGELALQQLDVVDGDPRRHLYGQLLLGAEGQPDRLVYSLENSAPNSPHGTATVYEREIDWR